MLEKSKAYIFDGLCINKIMKTSNFIFYFGKKEWCLILIKY